MTITIYTKPSGCFACTKTKQLFDAAGVEYDDVDLTDEANAAAVAYVTEDLNYSQAPIVVVTDEDHWAGLIPGNIARICAAYGSAET